MESESLETVGFMQSTFEDPLHLQSIIKIKADSSAHILRQLQASGRIITSPKIAEGQSMIIEERKETPDK